jgi:hypothetical protein
MRLKEEIDKKDEEELNDLKSDLINTLKFSEQVLEVGHKFSRSIATYHHSII